MKPRDTLNLMIRRRKKSATCAQHRRPELWLKVKRIWKREASISRRFESCTFRFAKKFATPKATRKEWRKEGAKNELIMLVASINNEINNHHDVGASAARRTCGRRPKAFGHFVMRTIEWHCVAASRAVRLMSESIRYYCTFLCAPIFDSLTSAAHNTYNRARARLECRKIPIEKRKKGFLLLFVVQLMTFHPESARQQIMDTLNSMAKPAPTEPIKGEKKKRIKVLPSTDGCSVIFTQRTAAHSRVHRCTECI